MIELIRRAIEFAETHVVVLVGVSVAMLAATVIALPLVIVRLPPRYFADEHRPRPLSRHPLVHWLLMMLKNLLGLFLVVAGLFLVPLPGQGLLTFLIGLTIMNYPGKFKIERWLVRRQHVLPVLNWLRRRLGAEPFDYP